MTTNNSTLSWELPNIDSEKTIQQIENIEKTPFEQRNLPKSIYDVVRYMAEKYQTKTAIKYLAKGSPNEESIDTSYQELLESVTQTSNFFYDLGVKPDDVIAFIMPNLVESFSVYLGAETTGIALALGVVDTTDTIVDSLNLTNAKVLVLYGPDPTNPYWPKLSIIKSRVSSLEKIVVINSEHPIKKENYDFEIIDFRAEVKKQPKDKLKFDRKFTGNEIAAYCNTSSITGNPRIIKRTHTNQVSFLWSWSVELGITKDDCYISAFLLNDRDLTLLTNLIVLINGCTSIIAGKEGYYDVNVVHHLFNLIEKYRVSILFTVPFLIDTLEESASIKNADLSSLRSVVYAYGGKKFPDKLYKTFYKYTKIKPIQAYSAAEACYLGSKTLLDPDKGSTKCFGYRDPYLNLKTVILDENNKYIKDCDIDETGTIVMKGPAISPGYINTTEFDPWLEDGWFNTGDLGCIDSNGKLWIQGKTQRLSTASLLRNIRQ